MAKSLSDRVQDREIGLSGTSSTRENALPCPTQNKTIDTRVVEHLKHAQQRDSEKGGDGTRTTRELADALGMDIRKMRAQLNKMMRREDITGWDDHSWSLFPSLVKS